MKSELTIDQREKTVNKKISVLENGSWTVYEKTDNFKIEEIEQIPPIMMYDFKMRLLELNVYQAAKDFVAKGTPDVEIWWNHCEMIFHHDAIFLAICDAVGVKI